LNLPAESVVAERLVPDTKIEAPRRYPPRMLSTTTPLRVAPCALAIVALQDTSAIKARTGFNSCFLRVSLNAALKGIGSRGDWHRATEQQRQNIITQCFHHSVGSYSRRYAAGFGTVPLMPGVTIETGAVTARMTEDDHCIARRRHADVNSPRNAVCSFEDSR